jgi:enoyl-CoA hydratase
VTVGSEGPAVLVAVQGAVAVVTLNRPAARNALDSALIRLLPVVLAGLDDDPDVRVIVLTGADPAFCAGLDLRELGASGANLDATRPDVGGRAWPSWSPWPTLRTPIVGAVNGAAVTGGLELALHCDFLVASDRARFADTHARVGVMPGWGMTVLLPQAVGLRAARDMSATGRFVGADEALRLGLVTTVVDHAGLPAAARGVAAQIADGEPTALATLLASYRHASMVGPEEGLRHEAEVGRRWRAERFDPAEVARRRAGLLERNRAGAGGPDPRADGTAPPA